MITNSAEYGTNGWVTYNTTSVVKCSAQAYPNDVPDIAVQTVAFRNIYVQAGASSVTKIDSVTNHGMKDVAFKISRVDGAPMELYKNGQEPVFRRYERACGRVYRIYRGRHRENRQFRLVLHKTSCRKLLSRRNRSHRL